jgi:o-succinylbenzoate synthase
MRIATIDVFKLNTPLTEPFVISLETITHAESVVIKMITDTGIIGWGECNPYRTINGETPETCYAAALFLAKILRGGNPTAIHTCIALMDKMLAGNRCTKSAFDMALYDVVAKAANMPLYQFLGGENNRIVTTDMTVGINSPQYMADAALKFKNKGFPAIKIKLGTNTKDDVARIKHIREAVGDNIPLRIDANQGWDETTAIATLKALEKYDIEHCEQPVKARHFEALARVKQQSPIPIMADESCFDAIDAFNLIKMNACDYINIKLSKSGGIHNALKINAIAETAGVKCQIGCFSETRLAMSALMHFALASPNVIHFDMDAPLMLSADPVIGGVRYTEGGRVEIGNAIGIGAAFDESFF